MKTLLIPLLLVALALVPLSLPASADPGSSSTSSAVESASNQAAGHVATWERFNRLDLESTDRSGTYHAQWSFELAENGDLKIGVNERNGSESRVGQVMLVSGRALLIKGVKLTGDQRIDFIDGPVLMCQLAINLLHYAFADGPQRVDSQKTFDLQEKLRTVIISSPHSTSYFSPPWKLSGNANPAGEGIRFNQTFTYKRNPGDADDAEVIFKGLWINAPIPPQFSDSMSLEGWDVSLIDPASQDVAEDATCCKTANKQFRTLGDLRKHIAVMAQKDPSNGP
jgi:hypothetical protein